MSQALCALRSFELRFSALVSRGLKYSELRFCVLLSCGLRPSELCFRALLSCGPRPSGLVSCGWSSCGFRSSELWSCALLSCGLWFCARLSCELRSSALRFGAPLSCALLFRALLSCALLSCALLSCALLSCALLSCAVFPADGLSAWITLMVIGGVRSHTYLIPHNTSIGRVGWAPWRLAPTGLADPTARLAACHLLRWRTGISDHETIADIECHNVKVARVVAEYWHRQGWGKCTPFQPDKTRNRHVPGPVPVDQTPDRPARRIARWQVETRKKVVEHPVHLAMQGEKRVLFGFVIYKPAKSAMTSGRGGTKRWVLEFESQSPPPMEPLMGWTGSTDPMAQLRLSFPSLEPAVAYVERQGLYEMRNAAGGERLRVTTAKPQSKPMPLWPIPFPESEWNSLIFPETNATDVSRKLAA